MLIIPTGINARIGGYAGDALPVARALSGVVDHLITHPNVVNGAMMYWPIPNMKYVEGSALNMFASGKIDLLSHPISNRIGLLLDRGIEEDLRIRHIQVADAARATLGIDISHIAVTSEPLDISLEIATSGASWGRIGNIKSLIDAGKFLVHEKHCQAIAVVGRFPEEDECDSIPNLSGDQ